MDIVEKDRTLWRVPNVKRRKEVLPDFVPVIFANGEDDDLPGFEAAVWNQRVQYDDHIYEVGEAIRIVGRNMYFSVRQITVLGHDAPLSSALPDSYIIREPKEHRSISIEDCTIYMGKKL